MQAVCCLWLLKDNLDNILTGSVFWNTEVHTAENLCAYGSSYPVFNISCSERFIFVYLLRNQRLRNHPQVLGCVALPLHRCLPVEDPLLLPIWWSVLHHHLQLGVCPGWISQLRSAREIFSVIPEKCSLLLQTEDSPAFAWHSKTEAAISYSDP